jgi:AcrR family transcriptional regulator
LVPRTQNDSEQRNPRSIGRLNKHQQKTQATRRKLLEAARRIFVRDGFEAARLEDIAAEAGHTRGAFYANFQSKEELFFALLEQEATQHVEHLREDLEAATAEERLNILRRHFVDRLADHEWMLLTLEFKVYSLRHSRRAKIAEMHRRVRESLDLESITNLLPKRVRITFKEQEVCKMAMEAVLSGLALECVYDPKRISGNQAADILGRTFDVWVKSKNYGPGR